MEEIPRIDELLEAVRGFLSEAREELGGHRGFHALVAANVVDIARRELELGPVARAAEASRLRALLGRDGEPAELNRALCEAIRAGRVTAEDARLLEHLERTTLDRLAIDQPAYSGARIATEADGRREVPPRR